MFDNKETNISILEGSYRKLKSYYYYNKNFIFLKEKIAIFESNLLDMKQVFERLSEYLNNPNSIENKQFINELTNRVDFYILPKKIHSDEKIGADPVALSNILNHSKTIKSVNYFIDMPIELHILDTLLTLLIGKEIYSLGSIDQSAIYANTLSDTYLYNDEPDTNGINFENSRLFNIYYLKYSSWRNGAFDALSKNYSEKKSSVLYSLDISSYYYDIRYDFNFSEIKTDLDSKFPFEFLIDLFRDISFDYFKKVSLVKSGLNDIKPQSTPLPIGLFISMIISNLYLRKFDELIKRNKKVIFYGRYVDDILIVINSKKYQGSVSQQVLIDDFLVKYGILIKENGSFSLKYFSNLKIQNDKIKTLYLDKYESKSIIDIYNKKIRVIPSQVNLDFYAKMDLIDFDEYTHEYENFGTESKIRDIGRLSINKLKVSKFLTSLLMGIKGIDLNNQVVQNQITTQTKKLEKFFINSAFIEHLGSLVDVFYFFVITKKKKSLLKSYSQLLDLAKSIKIDIDCINAKELKSRLIKNVTSVVEISASLAMSIDYPNYLSKKCKSLPVERANNILQSNMFNNNLLDYPLYSYATNELPISLIEVSLNNFVNLNILNENKIKFLPRFVHLSEIMVFDKLLSITQNYGEEQHNPKEFQISVMRYIDINHLNRTSWKDYMSIIEKSPNIDYHTDYVTVLDSTQHNLEKFRVSVANINVDSNIAIERILNPNHELTSFEKRKFYNTLLYSIVDGRTSNMIVFPELFLPVRWLNEMINFSRKTQTAIITGMQYLRSTNNEVKNFIVTIIPFLSGHQKSKSSIVYIREKNDYPPLEVQLLAERSFSVKNQVTPSYQIFKWRNLYFSNMLCYELTDISARARFRGEIDLLAIPELNKDTPYFSNIIESCVRDLHAFIIQSNTSYYGDSRISGPYDRNHMNIIQIKGGINNYIVTEVLNIKELRLFQLGQIEQTRTSRTNVDNDNKKIKKLPARFLRTKT